MRTYRRLRLCFVRNMLELTSLIWELEWISQIFMGFCMDDLVQILTNLEQSCEFKAANVDGTWHIQNLSQKADAFAIS